MIGWLKRTFIYSAGDAPELDHLPLNTTAKQIDTPTVEKPKVITSKPDWETKYATAKKKLGRPFAPEVRVSRATEPSHQLAHIEAQAEEAKRAKATVTPIGRKTK